MARILVTQSDAFKARDPSAPYLAGSERRRNEDTQEGMGKLGLLAKGLGLAEGVVTSKAIGALLAGGESLLNGDQTDIRKQAAENLLKKSVAKEEAKFREAGDTDMELSRAVRVPMSVEELTGEGTIPKGPAGTAGKRAKLMAGIKPAAESPLAAALRDRAEKEDREARRTLSLEDPGGGRDLDGAPTTPAYPAVPTRPAREAAMARAAAFRAEADALPSERAVRGERPPAPATPPAATAMPDLTELGAPSADRAARKYTEYTPRDLVDQIVEIKRRARAGAATPEDARAKPRIVAELDRRSAEDPTMGDAIATAARALLAAPPAPPAAMPTAPAVPGSPGTSTGGIETRAPGYVSETGEGGEDVTRDGLTVKHVARGTEEAVATETMQAAKDLAEESAFYKTDRGRAMRARAQELYDTTVAPAVARAKQRVDVEKIIRDKYNPKLYRDADGNLQATPGESASSADILALARNADTPEEQASVLRLAYETGMSRPTTIAERVDPAAMHKRLLDTLPFPKEPRKSLDEVVSEAQLRLSRALASEFGNDAQAQRVVLGALKDSGLLSAKGVQETTRRYAAENKASADQIKALNPGGGGTTTFSTSTTTGTSVAPAKTWAQKASDMNAEIKADTAKLGERRDKLAEARRTLTALSTRTSMGTAAHNDAKEEVKRLEEEVKALETEIPKKRTLYDKYNDKDLEESRAGTRTRGTREEAGSRTPRR